MVVVEVGLGPEGRMEAKVRTLDQQVDYGTVMLSELPLLLEAMLEEGTVT